MFAVLDISPEIQTLWRFLAEAELRLGKPESAEAHILDVLRSSPGRLTSAVGLANSRCNPQGTSAGAEEVCNKPHKPDPRYPQARFLLGDFYRSQNRTSDAEHQYRKALAIDPNHGASLAALASLLIGRTNH